MDHLEQDGLPEWEPPHDGLPALRMQPMPPVIAAAVMAVCKAVETIAYDGQNKHDNYAFASVDAFLGKIGKLCADADLIILPEEVRAERVVLSRYTDNSGRERREEMLAAVYRFWLVHSSGAMWGHPMERRIELRWNGPQAYGSAESYVLKRFMRALFKVPTGDTLDPASDMADPDLRRDGRQDRPAQTEDPLFGRTEAPPPFISATEKARSGRGQAPPVRAEPPATELPPTNGEAPYRLFNGLGESVAEYQDLKTWGGAMKKHLTKYPAAAPLNKGEVRRLRDFFLGEPDMHPATRKALQTAFDSLAPLLDPEVSGEAASHPPPPRDEPPHDPDTGELLPPSPEVHNEGVDSVDPPHEGGVEAAPPQNN